MNRATMIKGLLQNLSFDDQRKSIHLKYMYIWRTYVCNAFWNKHIMLYDTYVSSYDDVKASKILNILHLKNSQTI